MTLEPIDCNNCGAALEVAAGTNFVTCTHCGSRLAVRRTATSRFTELLDKLDAKTDAMADDLADLAYHAELERVDREWEMERRRFLATNKDGTTSAPSAAAAVIGGLIAAAFGIFFTATAASMGAPVLFPLFGLLFVGFGLWMAVVGPAAATRYADAEREYRRRRAAVRPRSSGPSPTS